MARGEVNAESTAGLALSLRVKGGNMRLTYLSLAVAALAGSLWLGLTGCSDDKPPAHSARPAVAAKPSIPIPQPVTHFGDGKYEVGTDILAGRYKTTGPPDGAADKCYWARLKDFSGAMMRSNIAMGYGNKGPDVVVIEPGDKGFESRFCGLWTRVGE
jgi:hypothetical protein